MMLVSAVLSLVIAGSLIFAAEHMIGTLSEQNAVKRWSKDGGWAQVSCFFSANAWMDQDAVSEFEHGLDSYLLENSIEPDAAKPGSRLWVDAYSEEGRITLSSERTSLEADALGVGGDFFLLHPQKLLYGSLFSGSDLNQDYCVIDEDAAWQLFGSNDVAGMTVYISGVPHIVSGVIRRPDGRLIEAAGLDATEVYVSCYCMEHYGTAQGINHYEILMIDPVKQFAYKYVKEKLGSDERETEIVENSARFSLLNRLKRFQDFGTRSMNGRAIIYPYWENLARGYEDIVGTLTFLAILFSIYPLIYIIWLFIDWKKHKGWTIKEVWGKIKDKAERFREKQYYSKNKKGREDL